MIALEPGSLFSGRYKIQKTIGAGGMGAVYLATDSRHPEFRVALKVLYPGIIKSKEAKERFRNEILASYRVTHKNIIRAYEYFDQEEFQAFSMEFVDGGDLLERMRKGRLPLPEVIDILKQIAAGLAAVHAEGILHRDLKPENILLTKKGEVKISDFGVARLKGSGNLTELGAMVGTPKYLSPEYVETGECDHRSDIYAVGIIGYELLTGASPFRAESKVSLMVERLRNRFEPIVRLAPECPSDLAKIVETAMSVSVNRRYQSASELERDLTLVEQGKKVAFANEETETSLRGRSVFSEALKTVQRKAPSLYSPVSAAVDKFDEFLYRLRWMSRGAKIISLAFIGVIAAELFARYYLSSSKSAPQHSPFELVPGYYQGFASGVLGENSDYGLAIWRTSQGVFVLLGKPHCSVAQLSEDGFFACGDLRFRMSVDSLRENKPVGTIEELGWGTRGTWSVGPGEEG